MSEPEHSPSGERHGAADGTPASRSKGAEPGSAGPGSTELGARLERLNSSLSRARAKGEVPEAKGADTSSRTGVALAFRLGAEFVSGVLVGAAIGYGVDTFLAITPGGPGGPPPRRAPMAHDSHAEAAGMSRLGTIWASSEKEAGMMKLRAKPETKMPA